MKKTLQEINGRWFVVNAEEQEKENEEKNMNPCMSPSAVNSSMDHIINQILRCTIASLLGVSLALNYFLYKKIENFKDEISNKEKAISSLSLDFGS